MTGSQNISMTSILNFLIYSIIYIYLFTAAINFFFPITIFVAVIVLCISFPLSYASLSFIPLNTFQLSKKEIRTPKAFVAVLFLLFLPWALAVITRPTTGDDANVYHLPLSLLMNHSVWYPGIGKLSSHFGFPNGTSVLASIFTSFGIIGFENIPSLATWVILGIGIFLYLTKNGIPLFMSIATSFVFILTPSIFAATYNIGTDLPCASFLTLGLLALSDKQFKDCCLFFALSALFKPLGILAACLVMPYVFLIYVRRKEKTALLHPKVLISILLLAIVFMRTYIATGNPFYPSWPLQLAPWGISMDMQNALIGGHGVEPGLRHYTGVERTFWGFIVFIKNFILFPHVVKSAYWFSPFLAACLLVSVFYFVKRRYYQQIDFNTIYLVGIVQILFLAWFIYSPLFRFIAGVLIFINLKLFIFVYNLELYAWRRLMIQVALFGTLFLFVFNVAEHVGSDVLPLINASEEGVESFMPWVRHDRRGVFSIESTRDGFIYSKSSSTVCQRMKPPCISERSVDDEEALIKEFRKYNKL